MSEKYIISDAAKMLDIEPHVLRYWEDELELEISRNQLGHRYYSEENLDILKRVKQLKETGLQLKAIKMLLGTENDDNTSTDNTREVSTINTELKEQDDKLKQFQEFMKVIFQSSLKENNDILLQEMKEYISKDLRTINDESEKKAELRFRKLDETMREMQKTRQEVALANSKRRSFFKKNKSS